MRREDGVKTRKRDVFPPPGALRKICTRLHKLSVGNRSNTPGPNRRRNVASDSICSEVRITKGLRGSLILPPCAYSREGKAPCIFHPRKTTKAVWNYSVYCDSKPMVKRTGRTQDVAPHVFLCGNVRQ